MALKRIFPVSCLKPTGISIAGLIVFIILFAPVSAYSAVKYPFYIGASGGYGSTNWSSLTSSDPNLGANVPISSDDDGAVWGLFTGYQFIPQFAIEFDYHHFADTTVNLRTVPGLPPAYWNDYHRAMFISETNVASLVAKVMVQVGEWPVYGYITAGGAYIRRNDDIADKGHVGPAVGVGLDYDLTQSIFLGLDMNYYSGFGKTEKDPVRSYIPFVDAVTVSIGYRLPW